MSVERVKLTKAQRNVLEIVGRARMAVLKGDVSGDDWRRLDRLVALGLVQRQDWGAHRITEAGRAALAGEQ